MKKYLFCLAYEDTKNIYIVCGRNKKEAIKKLKKEFSLNCGKIYMLVPMKTDEPLIKENIESKDVKVIEAKRFIIRCRKNLL